MKANLKINSVLLEGTYYNVIKVLKKKASQAVIIDLIISHLQLLQ